MNIAIALVSREAGGSEFQACLLADELRKRGHTVTFYCTGPAKTEEMLEQFPAIPARIATWPQLPRVLSRFAYLGVVAQFKRWLHRDRIEAAIGFLPMPHGILSAACLGTRVRLIGRRGCVWSEIKGIGTYDRNLIRLIAWRKRWGWRTQGIVANSLPAARDAVRIEGWPGEKMSVIPNGWPEFPASNCLSNVPYYCARPREEKAVDRATREFASRGVPLALSFEPPDWSQVGILVHCSLADSMSNSVGMAAAHGIPVAAFLLPGTLSMVGMSRCVPKGEYESLVAMVRDLWNNRILRVKVGRDIRSRIRSTYPLKEMIDRWENVLSI